MIDAHIHLEKGPYTSDWLSKFIENAKKRGITELYLLEHSHCFKEFKPIYNSLITDESNIGAYQKNWLAKRFNKSLEEYKNFIQAMRKNSFPLIIKFGLEICYFPKEEKKLKI